MHTGAGASLAVDPNRPDPTVVPLGPSGGGGLFSTASDYARFCEMLLQGGQFNGVRLLAPRTVEMMRTNHVNPDPLKTMAPGTGWGMDFQVVMDAAAAGDSVLERHVHLVRHRGHVVLDRSGRTTWRLSAWWTPEPADDARDSRSLAQPRLRRADELRTLNPEP